MNINEKDRKWNVVHECDDDDGQPNQWSIDLRKETGFFWRVDKYGDGEYSISYGECDSNKEEEIHACRSLTGAFRWVVENCKNVIKKREFKELEENIANRKKSIQDGLKLIIQFCEEFNIDLEQQGVISYKGVVEKIHEKTAESTLEALEDVIYYLEYIEDANKFYDCSIENQIVEVTENTLENAMGQIREYELN